MIIYRWIDGKPVQIALTEAELVDAYLEQQMRDDEGTVMYHLGNQEDASLEKLVTHDARLLSQIAREFRQLWDAEMWNQGELEQDFVLKAVDAVMAQREAS